MVSHITLYRGGCRFSFQSHIGNPSIESNLCILLQSWQEQGILVLKNAIACCAESIEEHKGKLTLVKPIRAVSVAILSISFIFYISMFKFCPSAFGFSFILLCQYMSRITSLHWKKKEVWQGIVIQDDDTDGPIPITPIQDEDNDVSSEDDSEDEEDTGMGEVDVENGNAIMEWEISCAHSKTDSTTRLY